MSPIPDIPPAPYIPSGNTTVVTARSYGAYSRADDNLSYSSNFAGTNTGTKGQAGYLLSAEGEEPDTLSVTDSNDELLAADGDELMNLYEVQDKDIVLKFVASRPFLSDALVGAKGEIEKVFGDTVVELGVNSYDDEYGDRSELVLTVRTDRPAREIPSLLDKVDELWTFKQHINVRESVLVMAYSIQK